MEEIQIMMKATGIYHEALAYAAYKDGATAIRHNEIVRQQYVRLRARGKSKMSALGAAMRKLVQTRLPDGQVAFGVLKHQTVYSPQAGTL